MVMDQDPIESLPAPDIVGREFVRQYYTLLNEAPEYAHRFYNSNSSFVHGSMTKPAIGQQEIHHKIQQLNFRDCHAKISQVDSQVTLGNGVVVQVSGELSNDGLPMRRFSQTFVLGTQSPKKYYVHNDIFRYQDMLQSDEEGDSPPEKEDTAEIEQQEPRDYYPSVPLEQTGPPQQQVPAGLNVNAPPHAINVNGTGLHHEEPVPEPIAVVEVAPAPVMNGGVSIIAGEDISRTLPPSAPAESAQTGLVRQGAGHLASEELAPQPVTEVVNNKDDYEENTYQTQNTDSNEVKPTFANLLRSNNRGSRGAPPPRVARSNAPPQPAPAPAQSQRTETSNDSHPGLRSTPSDACQVFMGNIPVDVTENELRPIFEEFGPVLEVRIQVSRTQNNGSKNFGFVTFSDPADAANCLKNKHLPYHDAQINVEVKRRQNKGGGGGHGDSGHEGGGWSMNRGRDQSGRDQGHESGSWSMGRGQSGRGRGPPRGAPRGSSFSRGSAPLPSRGSYPSKR